MKERILISCLNKLILNLYYSMDNVLLLLYIASFGSVSRKIVIFGSTFMDHCTARQLLPFIYHVNGSYFVDNILHNTYQVSLRGL